MFSSISTHAPLPQVFPASGDGAEAADAGGASVPTAGSQAVSATLPVDGGSAMHDEAGECAAGNADHDPEAAAAHQFWLPTDAWSSIAEFLPLPDVLSLRTTSNEMKLQTDDALRAVKIRSENLGAFLDSDGFRYMKNLKVSLLDQAALDRLTAHLAANPRPAMTLTLSPPNHFVDAAALARLSNLTLDGLVLELHSMRADELNALAACRFPMAMHELRNMTSLRNLIFDSRGTRPYPRLDAATSQSIAALPVLEFIAFPFMEREPGALTPILKNSKLQRPDTH